MLLWHARGLLLSVSVCVVTSEPRKATRACHPPTGRGGEVPSSIIAASVTASEESTCSVRSAARTNDVDADQRCPKIGNEEGTSDTSTLNPTPLGPPEGRRETGTPHQPAVSTPNPYPRRRTRGPSPQVTHIHA